MIDFAGGCWPSGLLVRDLMAQAMGSATRLRQLLVLGLLHAQANGLVLFGGGHKH
jgi:hypothetical protein